MGEKGAVAPEPTSAIDGEELGKIRLPMNKALVGWLCFGPSFAGILILDLTVIPQCV